jgi:hypothetical protein
MLDRCVAGSLNECPRRQHYPWKRWGRRLQPSHVRRRPLGSWRKRSDIVDLSVRRKNGAGSLTVAWKSARRWGSASSRSDVQRTSGRSDSPLKRGSHRGCLRERRQRVERWPIKAHRLRQPGAVGDAGAWVLLRSTTRSTEAWMIKRRPRQSHGSALWPGSRRGPSRGTRWLRALRTDQP